MTKDLSVSLSIQLKQTDAKARIAEIGKEFEKLGLSTKAPIEEVERLKQKLGTLRDAAKIDVARNIIGVEPFRNVQQEINKVTAAFARLKASGQLSSAELGQAFLKTQERIEELKGSMNGIGSYFEKIRGQALALGAQLAVFGLAAKQAIEFEDALVDLRRAANLTQAEAKDMGREFKDLSEELGMSAVSIAKLATEAAKTGVAKQDLLEFARIAATAGMNFDMIPEEAGEALGKLKNIFGLAIGDMEAFVAMINDLADNAAATERDIIEALKLGGGDARLFGLDPKQAAALATGFLNVGASAEQAGTAMRTLLGRLRDAVTKGGAAGQALRGVVGDTRVFAKTLAVDANGAMMTFLSGLSKLSGEARSQALKDLFMEGLDTSNIAKLTNDFERFSEVMARAGKSDDELVQSLRELTARKLGSTQSELNLMAAAWRNAGQAVGELFLPAIRLATVALAAPAKAIRYLAEEFPVLSRLAAVAGTLAVGWGALRGIGTVLVAVLGKLGINIAAVTTFSGALAAIWGRVVAAFGRLAAIVGPVFTALRAGTGVFAALRVAAAGLMGPVGWIITGLSLLAAAWDMFGKDKSREAALARQKKAFDEVSDALKGVGEASNTAKGQIAQAMSDARSPVEALAADYKLASEQIKTSLAERMAAIDAAAQRETTTVQTSQAGQQAQLRETARIALEAEQQKASAVDQAGQQMLSAWGRTYGQALEIERAAGVQGSGLAKEANEAKLAIYKQLEGAYRATIDKLIGEEQRHLAAVREIEQQRLMLKMSVEDKLRSLKQKTMSDEQAYADRVKQIDEKLAKAREASAAGQTELAKRYAEEAMSLAQSNANAVTQTVEQGGKTAQQTVVTLEQAVTTSSGQIQQAYQIIDQGMTQTAKTHQEAALGIGASTQDTQGKLDALMSKIDEIRAQQAVEIEAKLSADEAASTEAIAQLQRLADAQAVQVKMDADLTAATTTLTAWKQQPGNTELALKAMVAQESLAETAADLKVKMEAANLQAPVGLDPTKAVEAMGELVEDLNETETASEHDVTPDMAAVNAAFERLNNTVTRSTHYIQEIIIPARSTGGPIQRLADGGRAWRRIVGKVRGAGTATSDSIRAMLSNGEFVLREKATSLASKFLPGFVERLNAVKSRADLQRLLGNFAASMAMPAVHLAGGGPAAVSSSPAIAALPGGSGETLTWLIRAGESEVPVRVVGSDSRRNLHIITDELYRLQLLNGKR